VCDPTLFLAAFDAAPSGLLLIDPATRTILAANRAFSALASIEPAQLLGQPIDHMPIFRDRPELAATCVSVAPGESASISTSTATEERQLEATATGFSVGGRNLVQCSVLEVTARKRHDRHTRQTEKMEPLRVLAGTAAHDFNNMLTCVRGYVSVALETPSLAADVRGILDHVKGATTRAGELTQRLLGFSRKRKLQTAPLELGSFLDQLAPAFRATLPPTIELVVAPPASPVAVIADSSQLKIAVDSLLRNAREAIRERGQITLSVSVVHEPGSATSTQVVRDQPGRPFACLTVQDDGCGLSPALQARLFEPGVTTKKTGGTSGMSLAYAYSIVADHGGWIDVRSQEGRGSTFAVMLPLAPATALQ
jgi:two-component system cell cycle sensor histidine kinase/response regulator CckA